MISGTVAHLDGKPEEDSSMQQSRRVCLGAFTVRPDCPVYHTPVLNSRYDHNVSWMMGGYIGRQ